MYTIPYLSKPQYSQSMSIDGYVYQFDFTWNRRTQTHFLSVVGVNGVCLTKRSLQAGEKILLQNLPSDTSWFLYLSNSGNGTPLDKIENFLLTAWVFENDN